MTIDLRKIEKVAGLGAKGAAGGLLMVWLGLILLTRPVSSGGMDARGWYSLIAASGVVVGWLALAHWWFGVQLQKGADTIRG